RVTRRRRMRARSGSCESCSGPVVVMMSIAPPFSAGSSFQSLGQQDRHLLHELTIAAWVVHHPDLLLVDLLLQVPEEGIVVCGLFAQQHAEQAARGVQ